MLVAFIGVVGGGLIISVEFHDYFPVRSKIVLLGLDLKHGSFGRLAADAHDRLNVCSTFDSARLGIIKLADLGARFFGRGRAEIYEFFLHHTSLSGWVLRVHAHMREESSAVWR